MPPSSNADHAALQRNYAQYKIDFQDSNHQEDGPVMSMAFSIRVTVVLTAFLLLGVVLAG